MPKILSFPYFGPGRRSDRRVVEIRLNFAGDDSSRPARTLADIRQRLIDAGALTSDDDYPNQTLVEDRMSWYSSLLAQTALLLQRKNGHRVEYFSVRCIPEENRCIAVVEHEHSKVGMAAVQLAIEAMSGESDSLTEAYRSFSELARDHLLPAETKAIIDNALLRNIPVFQLEREPLSGRFDTGFRVRPNGLLSLGHGAANHILDGTFCVDRAGDFLKALLRNPGQRAALLSQSGAPAVNAAAAGLSGFRQFHLICINQQVTAMEQLADGKSQAIANVHESLLDLCRTISKKVSFSPVSLSIKAPNISQPLSQTGGFTQDFDLAPDLGMLLGQCEADPGLLQEKTNDLLNWLFPDDESARIPIIAVTGTNGKTTTSRMISHIMQLSGHTPGLVCTDGIFISGNQFTNTDASSFIGHARVLTSKMVDVAVLEAHHRGIAIRGFAFQHCDIAVCLNVTPEHLQKGEIETVEQMAVIKRSLLERASDTAIVFYDDIHCASMLDFVKASRICLVSLQSGAERLAGLVGKKSAHFCVLEVLEGAEWIILHSNERRFPIMPVRSIPATIDGTARFNVSNAMHAIAASFFAGVDIEKIGSAMGRFYSGYDTTPGRLNIFDGLPFRVVMDYAHNADGFRKISEFVDGQSVTGKKILMFGYSGDRLDADIQAAVTPLVDHFDHFVCRNFRMLRNRQAHEIPNLLKSGLISAGIAESNISKVPDADEAVRHSLSMAAPGDLVVLLVGSTDFQSVWHLLNSMAASRGSLR